MTRYITYFILCIVLVSSCGETKTEQEQLLPGSWNLVQVIGNGSITIGNDINDFALTSGEPNYVATFDEDGYILAGSYSLTTETTTGGVKNFSTLQYDGVTGQGNYTINENIIESSGALIGIQIADVNLGIDVGMQNSTIETITNTQMTLSTTQTKTQETDNGSTKVDLVVRTLWTRR